MSLAGGAADNTRMTIECRVYRCSKQDEMYLYLRADLAPDSLPEALLQRTGRLVEVMALKLSAERKLARADVEAVIAQLTSNGFYLQMPPQGQIRAMLYEGD